MVENQLLFHSSSKNVGKKLCSAWLLSTFEKLWRPKKKTALAEFWRIFCFWWKEGSLFLKRLSIEAVQLSQVASISKVSDWFWHTFKAFWMREKKKRGKPYKALNTWSSLHFLKWMFSLLRGQHQRLLCCQRQTFDVSLGFFLTNTLTFH